MSKQSLDSTRACNEDIRLSSVEALVESDGEPVEPLVRDEDREIQCGRHTSGAEGFALDIAEVESAIVTHKIGDGIELLLCEARVVGNYNSGDDGGCFAVLMLNLGN